MTKGDLLTGTAYWMIDGEIDTEAEVKYRRTDSTFYFECRLKDPTHGDSEVSGELTKAKSGIFNGSYKYKCNEPPYTGDISGCSMTRDKLSGIWFEDRKYGWQVEFDK